MHDDLSEFWEPVWFADFAAHAAAHGLGFVGEADLSGLRSEQMPAEVEPEVWKLAGGDRIAFEQYSDLLMPRVFRQSVLCRGRPRDRARAGRRAGCAAALGRSPERRAARRGPASPTPSRCSTARSRSAVSFEALRERLDAGRELGEALLDGFRRERLIPHAGPLPRGRAPASARRSRRSPAGRRRRVPS